MTTITLNLLADELDAQQAEARDPLKIAIACGVALVCLAVVAGTVVRLTAGARRNQASALQRQWDEIQARQQATSNITYGQIKAVADEILRINQSRLLFAPELAVVKDAIPPSIQLSRLRFHLAVETPEGPPPPPMSSDGKETEFKARRPAPKPIERLSLQIEGRAFGPKPELEVDAFMKSLRDNPAFADRLEQVQLRSIARSAADADKTSAEPLAQFVLECLYKPR